MTWDDLEGMESWERPDYAEEMYEQADLARKRLKENTPDAREVMDGLWEKLSPVQQRELLKTAEGMIR